MLSFLHRWDYCWKCEFDADVKIENYYHGDGEQILFYKIISQHTATTRMSLKPLYCCKKRRIPIYLIKSVLKRKSNAIFNIEKIDWDESLLNR